MPELLQGQPEQCAPVVDFLMAPLAGTSGSTQQQGAVNEDHSSSSSSSQESHAGNSTPSEHAHDRSVANASDTSSMGARAASKAASSSSNDGDCSGGLVHGLGLSLNDVRCLVARWVLLITASHAYLATFWHL